LPIKIREKHMKRLSVFSACMLLACSVFGNALYAQDSAKERVICEICDLYLELIKFKDDTEFHQVAFRADTGDTKYVKWKRKVECLEEDPACKLALEEGIVVGDLILLGLEYAIQGGRETEYSKRISQQFRKAPNL
jgi:hypothetical protein